jgi:arylsulfatase A-like enzyme
MSKIPELERPHLMLICVDALRADCLTGAGLWSEIGRPEAPSLDALGSSARLYSSAVASSSWTKPAVPSILTSLHPSEHGVLEVAKGPHHTAQTVGLPDSVPTLAELLRDAGYRTIGLAHNAQLDRSLGFSRGFDVFSSDAGPGDDILRRLREQDPFRDPGPVFAYLHFIEPHWPYGGGIARRAESEAVGRFPFHRFRASQWKTLKRELKRGEVSLTAEETRFLRRLYALAVEEADRVVGRCLAWLDDQGALEKSIVLLTSDHGEELLDHGMIGHGQSLYEELVRVPLILRAGDATRNSLHPGRSDDLASHVDILPTLAEAAGIEITHPISGRSILNGAGPAREHVFSEVKHKRRYQQSVRGRRWKLVREYRFRRDRESNGSGASDYNNLVALFAERPYRSESRLYDLQADPAEARDRFEAEPEVARRLESALDGWWVHLVSHRAAPHHMEEDMIRRLEALGYL